MQVTARGIISKSLPGTARANLTFPTLTALADGALLATWRAGSTKDSSDEVIEFAYSDNGGLDWSTPWTPLTNPQYNGRDGTLKLAYLTELTPGHLLVASMWIDRSTYPGRPLFNEETEGCLPMSIFLADSFDRGRSWSAWRPVSMPDEIGPASLTSPLLKLANGSLAMSIETNKEYLDSSPWMQRAVLFHSTDQGLSWSGPIMAAQDPTGRIFNWDMRCGVAPDGRIATFTWTYDSHAAAYINIHRRISSDHGTSWSEPEDLGFADQAARPAFLVDGTLVLAYVDRFQSHSIRARRAPALDAPFDPASDTVIYAHGGGAEREGSTGDLLTEMSVWNFGLPYAEALADGDVMVVYYAGTQSAMDIHWARLRL